MEVSMSKAAEAVQSWAGWGGGGLLNKRLTMETLNS